MSNQYDGLVQYTTLRGIIQRLHGPDNEGYVRGALKTSERALIFFSGRLPELDTGMEVELRGHYAEDEKRFNAYEALTSRTPVAALGQLLRARIKGFGPARAALHCGGGADIDDLLDKLYRPEWNKHFGVRAQTFPFPPKDQLLGMLHLYSLGYPTRVLTKVARAYGVSASVRPRTAPYSFVLDRVGVSFYIEDYVQRSIGNADPEVRALAAGCALEDWVLSDLDGHTVFPLTFLVDRLARILDSTATVARKAFSEYLANQSYHPAGTQWAPEQLVRAEVAIAKRVHSAQKEMLPPPKGLRLGDLDAAQKTAVLNAFTHKFSVITGGPGTGKTTSIKTLVAEATARNYNVQLLAPTGKAARRMSEVAGMGASTIHRYLPRNFERMHTFEETSADDMLIVDEASMVDTTLMAALLRYAPNAQIVCVGDANQLPSVGPGAVLEDLVRSDRVKTTHLQTIHRSAASSWMVREAPGILKGALSLENTSDFTFLEVKQPQDLVDVCRDMLSQYPNCQILSPRRTGALGTDRLNARLQSMIHASGTPHTTYNEYLFYVGDPVVAVVNDYDHEIFNGDMGVVRQVSENALTVEYRNYKGTQLVEYVGLDMGCIQPAYVLSVHRYQGSEARHVVVLCHSHMGPTILTRRLLYTAVTRAKEKLHLVGDKLGVRMAVSTETRPRRTGLGLFLEDCHSWPEKVKEDL